MKNLQLSLLIILISSSKIDTKSYTTFDLLAKNGYYGKDHEVTTEDAYILSLHQISSKHTENASKNSHPVLLMHGLFSSSAEFILTKNSLGFYLFDNGYDVYMGNARGNQYSKRHSHLSVNSSEFWDFSFHEIGYYDLPAMIDFVLNATNASQLIYIGHSQGATVPLVLLSTRPEYNAKINQLHLSAPAPFMAHFPNQLLRSNGQKLVKALSRHKMLDLSPVFEILVPYSAKNCHIEKPFHMLVCLIIEFMTFGSNVNRIEADFAILPKFLRFLTPTISANQLLHFFQLVESGKFQKFDYGKVNLKVYGKKRAPEYDLEMVRAPTFIYCAERDGVVAVKVRKLMMLEKI